MSSGEAKKWYVILPFLSVGLILLGWSYIAAQPGSLFPSIAATMKRFAEICVKPLSGATLAGHVAMSLKRVLGAYFIACVAGIALGVCIGWFENFGAIVNPIFCLIRSVPAIAWIPLAILWFGIGETPKMFIIFMGSFVPVCMNTEAGMRSIDKLMLDAGKALGANKSQMLINVAFPSAMPAILAGIRTGLSTAWLCVLAAEMIVSRKGIGFLILQGQNISDMALIIACMVVIAIVNSILSTLLVKLEGVICPWLFDKKTKKKK